MADIYLFFKLVSKINDNVLQNKAPKIVGNRF